jgi:NitT/TauT family transport system ATP-binding protein
VVGELRFGIPRPRPIALGESQALAGYSRRIYDHFERLGVIHSDTSPAAMRPKTTRP